jgi:putative tryptophan/tyrosine transport system substrate-binding protein
MRRRDLIKLIGGGAVAWPLAARGQQSKPVIGFLSSVSEAQSAHFVTAFRRGLGENSFVEGNNVLIDYRFADGRYDRLPAQVLELVRRPVDVIVASGPPAANAARVATTSIPIVFVVGLDPVAAGLVASFNRPGGNATGISLVSGPLGQKRLELLRELEPKATEVTMLVNPLSPDAPPEIRDVQAAAQANGFKITLLNASTLDELKAALGTLSDHRSSALLVGADPFFMVRREQLVALVGQQKIPAVYPFREFADAGGLMSYGTNIANAYRQAGIYAGRILKGAKPADLPVLNPTSFELIVNLKAARAIGLEIPPALHARSDEVIE